MSNTSGRVGQIVDHFKEPTSSFPIRTVASVPGGPRLLGKVAIITGCNSTIGIGRASALNFGAQGAQAIYMCDLRSENLENHAAGIQKLYPDTKVHTRTFDAADGEALQRVISEALGTYGRLDIFYANAARATPNFMDKTTGSEFMETMRINSLRFVVCASAPRVSIVTEFPSVFLAIKYASEAMKKTSASKQQSGGSIICTASVAGLRSGAGSIDYSASKAAVISLAQTGAWQLGGTGIRVNAVCPGLIETGMTVSTFDAARTRGTQWKIGQLNPMKRYGTADEIARMVTFLASDDASYVNAQAIAVDGGLTGSSPVVPGKMH